MAAPQNGDEDENEGFWIIRKDRLKSLGLIAGPFYFLRGCYILFMWTRRLQVYLLVECGDSIGFSNFNEEEVKAVQRKIKPWLLWGLLTGMGIAFMSAGIHAYGQYR